MEEVFVLGMPFRPIMGGQDAPSAENVVPETGEPTANEPSVQELSAQSGLSVDAIREFLTSNPEARNNLVKELAKDLMNTDEIQHRVLSEAGRRARALAETERSRIAQENAAREASRREMELLEKDDEEVGALTKREIAQRRSRQQEAVIAYRQLGENLDAAAKSLLRDAPEETRQKLSWLNPEYKTLNDYLAAIVEAAYETKKTKLLPQEIEAAVNDRLARVAANGKGPVNIPSVAGNRTFATADDVHVAYTSGELGPAEDRHGQVAIRRYTEELAKFGLKP